MVLEHGGEYPSRRAAVVSVSQKMGCSAHTLNDWVKSAGSCQSAPSTYHVAQRRDPSRLSARAV